MNNYDSILFHAKDNVIKCLCRLISDKEMDITEMSAAIDNLNQAWDDLTNYLVRQREERDNVITHLMDKLACMK